MKWAGDATGAILGDTVRRRFRQVTTKARERTILAGSGSAWPHRWMPQAAIPLFADVALRHPDV
jgi:hypothetical protein